MTSSRDIAPPISRGGRGIRLVRHYLGERPRWPEPATLTARDPGPRTAAGHLYRQIKRVLIVTARRPQVIERLHRIRELSEGDTSECEETRAALALVKARIRELQMLLASARCIVDGNSSDRVELGSNMTLANPDQDDPLETYRIVGSVEADSRHGLVSDESPLGRAVLGRSVSEDVTVQAPAGAFMCALLGSAEYSARTSPEQQACEVARAECLEAFDPWSGGWYGFVVYHRCRRVWSARGDQQLATGWSTRTAARPDMR